MSKGLVGAPPPRKYRAEGGSDRTGAPGNHQKQMGIHQILPPRADRRQDVFHENHQSALGLVQIWPSTIWQLFVSIFSDIAGTLCFTYIKSDIDSNNQFEITTTVFSEHRCRIWFLRFKSDMCLRRGAVRLQKALRRLLEALFSDIEFTLVFTYQSPPRGPQGFERKPPWATQIHHQAATRRHIPHKAPKTSPKAPEQHPRCPKELPENPSGLLSAPEGPQDNISQAPRASRRAGGMRGAP